MARKKKGKKILKPGVYEVIEEEKKGKKGKKAKKGKKGKKQEWGAY